MEKPILFAVDDDPVVLRAVTRDLRSRYGEDYRVVRAESGDAAMEAVEELARRQEAIALFLIDQRMPGMNGVEFLAAATPHFPTAKRVLLTAYADTNAAIEAINAASVHYYLLKPWDPPQEKLFPVLDDLLSDWRATYRPPFSGVRVVGHRWSPQTHALKDFLARNQVPYQYLDIEQDAEAAALLEADKLDPLQLPVVFLPNGEPLVTPDTNQVAEQVGLFTQPNEPFYDLVIVGGGPAGLAAAVYAGSEGLRTVMIEKQAPGGQAGSSSRIENYLGFPSGISGSELARRATTQARRFGVEILSPQVASGLRIEGPYRHVRLADGSEIACHALIVAVGLDYRTLDVPGCEKLTGAGIYYGASLTEVETCAEQDVFVVGAGNSAGQAAIYLAEHAAQVNLIVRGDSLEAKMSQYLVDRIYEHPRIKVFLSSYITAVHGDDRLEAITLCEEAKGAEERLSAAGLFIFIGAVPSTQWLEGAVELDAHGFVLAGPSLTTSGSRPKNWLPDRDPYLLETSVPGVFVVGDVRAASVKRVASAVGEGSIAVQFVHQYLSNL